MAKALACDICGNFFKDNGDIPNAIKIGYTGRFADYNHFNNDHKDEFYEICPKCMETINETIRTLKDKRVEVSNNGYQGSIF